MSSDAGSSHHFATAVFAQILVALLSCWGCAGEPASGTPWRPAIERLDEALARQDLSRAELIWHEAHGQALRSRRWEGLIEVGDAYLRIGSAARGLSAARPTARRLYLAALMRARAEQSVDGALRTAEAFASLRDGAVVELCLRVAEEIATRTRDTDAQAVVQNARARLARSPGAGGESLLSEGEDVPVAVP
jgi:hypothetical protein